MLSISVISCSQARHESNTEISAASFETNGAETALSAVSEKEIAEIIDRNLDILTENQNDFCYEQDFINAHPEAFAEILVLGEAALPYLNEIGNGYRSVGEDTSGNDRCYLAKAAEYAIYPDKYDRLIPSPDGKYTVKATVNTFTYLADPFQNIKYDLQVIAAETGETVIKTNEAYSLYTDPFADICLQWTPDSKYAYLIDTYRHLYTDIHVFDIEKSEFYTLPNADELEKILGKKLTYTDENGLYRDRVHCCIDTWENNYVRVLIVLSTAAGGETSAGWYLYDLENQNILDFEFNNIINT